MTETDFTGFGPYLFAASLVLLCFGLVLTVLSWTGLMGSARFTAMQMMYALVGALLFSAYIVFDTQLIVSGKHATMRFEVDDWAVATIVLYVDIIQLFLFLLRLLGKEKE